MLSFKGNIEPTERSSKGDFRNDKKEEALHLSLISHSLGGKRRRVNYGSSVRGFLQGTTTKGRANNRQVELVKIG
jgi:hypothetical protein